MMTDETAIREQAKQWATEVLKFDEPLASMIHADIDEMLLSLVGMPFCPACESVLCGACGHCHSFELLFDRPECPNDNDDEGRECVAWYQAHKAVYTVQHMNDEE
jgi:hypothetical protein